MELDPTNSPLWRREMALREKMAPSEMVMAPNAERGKKTEGCGKKKGERNEKGKRRREKI